MSSRAAPVASRGAVFWSSLNGVAAVGLPFVVFAGFARLMAPAQFALVAVALAVLEMLKTLAPQGLYDVLVTHDEGERTYHEAAAAILLSAALVVMVTFWGVLAISQSVFGMVMPAPAYWLGLKVLFDLALLQPQAAMVRRAEIRRLSTRSLYSGVIGALIGMGVGLGVSPIGGLVSFYVIQSLVTFLATIWGAKVMARPEYHDAPARDMMGQALRASGVRVAAGGNNYLDQVLAGRMFLPAVVGQYNLGKRIEIVSVTLASSMAQIVWQPGFAVSGESGRRDAIARGVASVALVCGLPAGMFAVLAPVAVPFVFGAHWAAAAPVAAALALSGVVRALGSVAGAVLTVTRRNGTLLAISVAGLIGNVALIVVTAPYGIFTTAVAILGRSVLLCMVQYAALCEVGRGLMGIVFTHFVLPLACTMVICQCGRLGAAWLLAGETGVLRNFIELAISGGAGALVGVPWLLRKI
ncbi:MAG: oligosaccharide flippase family protein [Sphingomonadales bacterium]|nr:oligosaccharide flippase family protein [Sphingomonadales bacterium]MDE2168525.1 oligosaccharide flippase family protein [Sphingomonadales bacterium]